MRRFFQPVGWSALLTFIAALTLGCAGDGVRSRDDDDDEESESSSGEGETTTTGGGGYTPPAFATIQIVDTLVQPWMADGTKWDGTDYVEEGAIAGLAEALGAASPYAAAFDYIAGLANSAYAPPDPFAAAELWRDGAWSDWIYLCSDYNNDEDTFAPSWPGDPEAGYATGWSSVSVHPDMRIQVTIVDEDISEHDTIGVVHINYEDVLAALKAQQVHPVRVDDQGQGQVLFVGISAIPE